MGVDTWDTTPAGKPYVVQRSRPIRFLTEMPVATEGAGFKVDGASGGWEPDTAGGGDGGWQPDGDDSFNGEFSPENVSKHAGGDFDAPDDGGCRV